MNLWQLHDRLYIRPHTRHLNTSKALETLRAYDVRLMLNVALINDTSLEAACRVTGMEYRHEPLNDSGDKLNPDRVRTLAKDVVRVMEYGSVVINCDSGWNRCALIAVRALMYFHPERDADSIITEARKVRGQNLLWNDGFVAFLKSERNV
jgi:protein-tyrosine phosphatase